LARPAAINDAAPFSLPIRNIGYNLNADTKSLKFTPRSGSLPRIADVENGDDGVLPPTYPAFQKEPRGVDEGRQPPTPSTGGPSSGLPSSEPPVKDEDEVKREEEEDTTARRIDRLLGKPIVEAVKSAVTRDEKMEDSALRASEVAYKNIANRTDIAGYQPSKSNETTAVIDRDEQRIIGIRGTASAADVLTDVNIVVGTLSSSQRFKRDYENVRKLVYDAIDEGKTSVVLGGHSLGGTLVSKITETLIKEDPRLKNVLQTYTFNEGTSPIADDRCLGPGCENIKRQRIKGDIISAGGRNRYRTRSSKCAGSVSAHGLNQFTGRNCSAKQPGLFSTVSRLTEKAFATTAQVIKHFT